MGKRGWPKGKPRKVQPTAGPPEPPPAPPPPMEGSESGPAPEGTAFHPAMGAKRDGGKDALAAENQMLAERVKNGIAQPSRPRPGNLIKNRIFY